MTEFVIERARAFLEPKPAAIAPLTFLVGENSSGKSSFLALLRIAHELYLGSLSVSFNRAPFFLGAFDQIAHTRPGKAGRSKFFRLSLRTTFKGGEADPKLADALKDGFLVTARFEEGESVPKLTEYYILSGAYKFSIISDKEKKPLVEISSPSWSGPLSEPRSQMMMDLLSDDLSQIKYFSPTFFLIDQPHDRQGQRPSVSKSDAEILSSLWLEASSQLPTRLHSIAPVRSKPERVYTPREIVREPEGNHVPFQLATMARRKSKDWETLRRSLSDFGKESGLFREILVKNLGKSAGDPFQILLKTLSRSSNIIDVGYGVSQILPVLYDAFTTKERAIFLMQQPEVHLHPKAQAELGSLLVRVALSTGHYFIVETHSDYLIDRVRSLIREDTGLLPSDVSLLFFEKRKTDAQIHTLALDELGNITNAPKGYRKFFEHELSRFLGIRA